MIPAFGYSLLAAGLLLCVWTGWQAYRRLPVNGPQIVTALVIEGAILIQSVIAVVRVINGHEPFEKVTFLAYLGGVLLPLPLGVQLARLERTRWGSIALSFTAVVVAVMMLRLLQLWESGPSVLQQ